MLYYKIYLKNPQSHYIYIDLEISNINDDVTILQLPAWRPGRYELGNFAKNIKRLDVYNENNEPLSYTKLTKDTWEINTKGLSTLKVTYSYHTLDINAGNCYADENQLYINPVHLCLYLPKYMNVQHEVELQIPDNYKVVCTLERKNNLLIAQSFDELADSPILAAATIQSDYYEVNGTKFWLHFNGECKPDFEKLKSDFEKFTLNQLTFWESFPFPEYHFIFQILPYKFYHGVEHLKSTVIAIGPGYHLHNPSVYNEVLGVSCHELFHAWNVKTIRPIEMLPYDFSKENYARTGYVYEGFTTYYGDLLLLTSGVFKTEQYFKTLEERLIKHFHNYGRFNLSVAHSSWETWLDGYLPGAPYRKTNIYDEGNLIALMLDALIMQHTNNQKGLVNVCKELFQNFGKKNRGYSEQDMIELCEKNAGVSLKSFFDNYVYGTEDFKPQLTKCLNYLGIELIMQPSSVVSESIFGFKTIANGLNAKISLIAPYSPSWKAGLSIGDEILAINNYSLKGDFNDWMIYFKDMPIELTVSSAQLIKKIILNKHDAKASYFDSPKLQLSASKPDNYNAWLKLNS